MCWIKLNRDLRKGDKFKMDSGGQYPETDNRFYRALGKFKNYKDIGNIQEFNPETGEDIGEHTQVISKFTEGYNKFIFIKP